MKSKKAISLIVLVITVLILSILATTVIITLSNTNIISQAQSAVNKTEAQQIEEMKSFMYAEGILGNNPEPVTIGSVTLVWDDESKEVREEYDIIPSGFYYVGGTKDTGLIISDDSADENKGEKDTCTGNQFVWVPVDDFSTFVTEKEPYAENDWEVKEYNAMCASVKKYSGFYIARFEAGDGNAEYERTSSSTVSTVVSKKDVWPYNYVSWGSSMQNIGTTGAVYLAQNMYKNSRSVVSTLCYGVQWDAVMNFVSDDEHNVRNSISWGNYNNSTGDAMTARR